MTELAFWWHYPPLRAARIATLKLDVHITGGDHVYLGDVATAEALLGLLAPAVRPPRILASPMLLAVDGQKMSKTNGNCASAPLARIIELARECDAPAVTLPVA
jgi:hypothetical protein